MKLSSSLHAIVFLTVFGRCVAHELVAVKESSGEDDEVVYVSPDCAAVLLVTGGACGALFSVVFVNTLLSLLGFTSIGPQAGSFAAWWQSTFHFMGPGSIFASLQSIAMTGTGAKLTISGALVGGATSASMFQEVCTKVDSVDPNSAEGTMIGALRTSIEGGEVVWRNVLLATDFATGIAKDTAKAFVEGWQTYMEGVRQREMERKQQRDTEREQ
eukprot:CAMPEP_0197232522 /NCGR_PEP_ID=MMETSP1429-20130617/775_1 /TAXON_ID=49237 /ORGANISM="Chaetoceros  sp., Strain UNC1202" /LENGTH=214 /DNA_ID=CAMNT_0042690565 /DNA_START=62 /DNA_END=706 /DNA_ORIENTATION=-